MKPSVGAVLTLPLFNSYMSFFAQWLVGLTSALGKAHSHTELLATLAGMRDTLTEISAVQAESAALGVTDIVPDVSTTNTDVLTEVQTSKSAILDQLMAISEELKMNQQQVVTDGMKAFSFEINSRLDQLTAIISKLNVLQFDLEFIKEKMKTFGVKDVLLENATAQKLQSIDKKVDDLLQAGDSKTNSRSPSKAATVDPAFAGSIKGLQASLEVV